MYRINPDNGLWPPNCIGPKPCARMSDLPVAVRQHIYQYIPQSHRIVYGVGNWYIGYSNEAVDFWIDQFCSDPRNHWPHGPCDPFFYQVDPTLFFDELEHLKNLCAVRGNVRQRTNFLRMERELELIIPRYGPVPKPVVPQDASDWYRRASNEIELVAARYGRLPKTLLLKYCIPDGDFQALG